MDLQIEADTVGLAPVNAMLPVPTLVKFEEPDTTRLEVPELLSAPRRTGEPGETNRLPLPV